MTLEKRAAQLSARMPIGTPVLFWPGVKRGIPQHGTIEHEFTVIGGHTIVGWIDGAKSCIAATHIQKESHMSRKFRKAIEQHTNPSPPAQAAGPSPHSAADGKPCEQERVPEPGKFSFLASSFRPRLRRRTAEPGFNPKEQ